MMMVWLRWEKEIITLILNGQVLDFLSSYTISILSYIISYTYSSLVYDYQLRLQLETINKIYQELSDKFSTEPR